MSDVRLRVALVHGGDEVRLVVAALSEETILRELAEYVAARAPHQLEPAARDAVGRQLATGRLSEAVKAYFVAPKRWDEERLIECFAHPLEAAR